MPINARVLNLPKHAAKSEVEAESPGGKKEAAVPAMGAFVPFNGRGRCCFCAKTRSYRYTVPKKVRRLALKSALSSKVIDSDIIVLDELVMPEIKTKEFKRILKNLNADNSALVVIGSVDDKVVKSARNIPKVKTSCVNTINTLDILKYKKFIITRKPWPRSRRCTHNELRRGYYNTPIYY